MEKYSFNNVDDFMKSGYSIKFPYKRIYYTNSDIKKMFKNLSAVDFSDRVFHNYYKIHNIRIHSRSLLFINKPTILMSKKTDYNDFEMLSDMFQEENRMKCKFFSAISSPNVYFKKNVRLLASNIIKNKQAITPNTLRDELYNCIKECSSFKPNHLIYIIKLFNVKSVLDPCSGWGDRLMACMASGIRYVGVDPNAELQPAYQEMINFFISKKNQKKYTMIENTIQDAKLPNEKFDLVFTSPPYFKIEQYNNRGRVIECDENEWFDNFMKPMISKTHSKLKNGGHLVLVINQLPHEKYIQKMIDYIYTDKPDLHYLGVIGYSNEKMTNPQPIWIWRKETNIPEILYNPPIVITQHTLNNIKFNVFRDDELIGGTKLRALIPLFKSIKKTTFIYAGPPQGCAQLALAYAAKLTHKKIVLFLNKLPKRNELTNYALSFNSDAISNTVTLHEIDGNLKKIQECAEIYNKNHPDSHLISFGGNEPMFIKELKKSIKKAIPAGIKPKRIWLVAGSGTVLAVLYKIFPTTEFHVVQVGKKIWDDQLELNRTTMYISDENFSDIAAQQPPYPTVNTYDAKLWKYFKLHGRANDYIWNVCKTPI